MTSREIASFTIFTSLRFVPQDYRVGELLDNHTNIRKCIAKFHDIIADTNHILMSIMATNDSGEDALGARRFIGDYLCESGGLIMDIGNMITPYLDLDNIERTIKEISDKLNEYMDLLFQTRKELVFEEDNVCVMVLRQLHIENAKLTALLMIIYRYFDIYQEIIDDEE